MAMMTTGSASADRDMFELDVTLVESAPAVSQRDASEGGCGATCGSNSCTSNVA